MNGDRNPHFNYSNNLHKVLNAAAFALYYNTEKILCLLSKSIRRGKEKGKVSSSALLNSTSTAALNFKY